MCSNNIGFSLLSTGISTLATSNAYPLGSWQNLTVGALTLLACLLFHSFTKGFWKNLYVLLGLAVGYIISIFFNMVDFSQMMATINELGVVSFPRLFRFAPNFDIGAIISVTLVFSCRNNW